MASARRTLTQNELKSLEATVSENGTIHLRPLENVKDQALLTSLIADPLFDLSKLSFQDPLNNSALIEAIVYNNSQLVKTILARPDVDKIINLQDHHYGNSPLILTALFGGLNQVAQQLLAKNPNVNLQDKHGNTALHWACLFRNNELIDALLKANASLDQTNEHGVTPRDLYLYDFQPFLWHPRDYDQFYMLAILPEMRPQEEKMAREEMNQNIFNKLTQNNYIPSNAMLNYGKALHEDYFKKNVKADFVSLSRSTQSYPIPEQFVKQYNQEIRKLDSSISQDEKARLARNKVIDSFEKDSQKYFAPLHYQTLYGNAGIQIARSHSFFEEKYNSPTSNQEEKPSQFEKIKQIINDKDIWRPLSRFWSKPEGIRLLQNKLKEKPDATINDLKAIAKKQIEKEYSHRQPFTTKVYLFLATGAQENFDEIWNDYQTLKKPKGPGLG